jgi:selenocysteine-specific elongation factor
MPVIMGTAGHIDHGKTTLIKGLTGIDCDRLVEEKKRGITIELGFAFLDLAEGHRLGIVDVPGHERFVKNMVAGATGIDFVLLVIAADEGVMPQTREHLEICSLLGIQTGMVALTKTDMVDEEWLELVTEDVQQFLQNTFLEDAPMYRVSAHTGQGLDELRAALLETVKVFQPRRRSDLFVLPVDRVFTMRGHGTVVTGTLVSGNVSVGEDVRLYPGERTSKVRGLQSHGETVQTAPAGRRTAVNLPGLEVSQVERGQMVARPGALFPHQVWDLELTCLSSSPRALKHRTEIHFHHGSRECLARLYFLDREKLAPGETALCQVRFTEPMVGVYGDRVVVRAFSPLRTVAGGRIVNPLGRKVKRFSKDLEGLAALAQGQDRDLVEAQLAMAGHQGLSFAQLRIMTNLESKKLEQELQVLGGQQKALLFDKEERVYVSGQVADALSEQAAAYLADYHKREPLKQGVGRGALSAAWPRDIHPKLAHFLVERMLKRGDVVAEQEVVRLPGHKVSLASDQAGLRQTLLDAYQQGGLTPPNLKDVLGPLGLDFKEAAPVFRLLQEQGALVKVKEDMYFSAEAVERLKELIRGYFADNEEMGPVEFKELTGLSRKYAIPLLEYLDKEKLTVRVGDKRRLRKTS